MMNQSASRRNQIWASDITYIQTEEGWLHLAAIMDLYSRRIIGWAVAHNLGTELVAAALAMAPVHRRSPQGFYAGLLLARSGTFCQPTKQLTKEKKISPNTVRKIEVSTGI
jgi:transposase InsO family protein